MKTQFGPHHNHFSTDLLLVCLSQVLSLYGVGRFQSLMGMDEDHNMWGQSVRTDGHSREALAF